MDRSLVKSRLNPKKTVDKEWYLALLDEEKQMQCEEEHLGAVLYMLKLRYIARYRRRIAEAKKEIDTLKRQEDYSAKDYRAVLDLNAEIDRLQKKLDSFKCYFAEPYFARMDVVDNTEGYNSYYIGKKGDVDLEIVDWRAPLAVRYYQKSRVNFKINEYDYRTVLRRALSVKNGKILSFKNEYLSVKDVLTPEEIAGRDEEILFDPYLKSIIRDRKEDTGIRDIIRTIQEKQFDVITRPERESFVLQGCAGSGKTMILLHRLSYLMYNNEKLTPGDVLVITPSDSFNAFIDDLAQVLELRKVRTTTLRNYYFRVLKNEGLDLLDKLTDAREPQEYLEFLYSEEFPRLVEEEIRRAFEGIAGLFSGRECREVTDRLLADCTRRQTLYAKLKNASVRVRRAVLGEMKENKEGGFYFTKPFRALMGAFVQVEDFLHYVTAEDTRSPDYFFRQFVEFYRSCREIAARSEQIFAGAHADLEALSEVIEKEISDLKRYRRKIGDTEIFTYAERIARREELKKEALSMEHVLDGMEEGMDLFREFFFVLRSSELCAEAGKCETSVDISRWLYRKTVKKYKREHGMKGVYPSDGYALCSVLAAAGRSLTPRYGLVFVDEGQDVSPAEYRLLKTIHSDAAFNVFGDLKQNITPFRGVKKWDSSFGNLYELYRNYRNTNEIVDFVSRAVNVGMWPIGLHGDPVETIKLRQISGFFKGKQGLKAVIAKEEFLPLFEKRGFSRLAASGKLSKSKINVMTTYESKGLEFTAVAVYDKDMTENEKYISYTRALSALAIVSD